VGELFGLNGGNTEYTVVEALSVLMKRFEERYWSFSDGFSWSLIAFYLQ
jgi:hypothetical protein